MAIVVRCPVCTKRARLADTEGGQVVVCAACGHQFTVPPPPALEGSVAPQASGGASASFPNSRRGSWAIAGAGGMLIALILGIVAFTLSERSTRAERLAFAQHLKTDADDLAAKHRTVEALAKYRELQDYVAPHVSKDSDLQSLSDQAHTDAGKLLSVSVATPPPPITLVPKTAPAEPIEPSTQPTIPLVPDETRIRPPLAENAPIRRKPQPITTASTQPKVVEVPTHSTRPPIRRVAETDNQLSDEQIGKAIQDGVDFLISQFDKRNLELREGLDVRNGRVMRNSFHDGADVLCVYALMQCGEAINDPRLNMRGPFMLGAIEAMKGMTLDDHFATYSRGLRATALALYNRKEDKKVLRGDVTALLKTSIKGAYTYYDRATFGAKEGLWDNSNSQYGLLGVWSGAEAEVEVPSSYWFDVEKHWTKCQSSNGQWGYVEGGVRGELTMTCAGIASLFVCHDWLDAPKFGSAVGRDPFSPALKRGLEWLEMSDHSVNINGGMWGYALYGVERVGLASGFKYFGKHNWYPELARQVLSRQENDGSWSNIVDTAYALLFLSRGRHPILMNKLRYDGAWSNRPRDVANLAKEAGKQLERPINWQVVPLTTDWTDWTDSPILYLSGHQPPKLSDADVEKMREFVLAGGMLFVQADGDSATMGTFASELGRHLFPKYSMVDVPASHPLFSSVYKITTHPPLKMISNGGRILMLFSPTDIARRWQLREQRGLAGKPVFQLGINMFVYGAGRRDMRNRLDSNLITPVTGSPSLTIKLARISYAGNWDPEPYAWTRFSRWFRRQTGYALDVQSIPMRDLDVKQTPIAHLTGTTPYTFTPSEIAALKTFVEAGGVLLVDVTGGSGGFDESYHTLLAGAFPSGAPTSLFPRHPLLRAGPPGMEDLTNPKLRPYTVEKWGNTSGNIDIFKAGKGHVIYTSLDLNSGLLNTGTWGIVGFDPSYSQGLIRNLILWTVDGQKDP